MGFGSDILKEYGKIQDGLDRDLKASALNLYGDLVKSSPVDSGELRTSWQLPKQLDRFTWVITNIAPHAVIIDGGRREIPTVNGTKEIGSKQLPKGFSPVIKKTKDALQRKFNK